MQKKINIFIIILLVMTVFFGFMSIPVSAWGVDDVVCWDEYVVGATSGTSNFYNWETYDANNYGTVVVHSINGSTKSLFQSTRGGYYANTIINLGYDSSTDVDGIKFFFDIGSWSGSDDGDFVNFSIKNGATVYAEMRLQGLTGYDIARVRVVDANNTWHTLYNMTTGNDIFYNLYMFINFSHYGAYGDVLRYELFWANSSKLIISVPLTMAEWEGTFDYINTVYMCCPINSMQEVYYGQIEFDQTGYIPGEGDYPVSQWDYIGKLERDGLMGLPTVGVEEEYTIPFTGEIKAVDLFVTTKQFNDVSSNIYDYVLYINGESIGYYQLCPMAFIPYQGHYLLRWYWLNRSFEGELLVFEFGCAKEDSDSTNWYVHISEDDNDGDGNINFRYGEDGEAWFNGLFDQTHYVSGDEICMRFYYIGDLYEPPYNYTDWVGIKDNPPYYTNTSIPISYSISTKEYDNYMEIWREGERVGNDQGFGSGGENGLLLTDYSETIGFVPYVSGSYSVNIRRNSINVTAYAFTVLENPITNYYIYTIPNPSQRPNAFKVYYKYFHGEGKDGILTINPIQDFSDPLSHSYVLFLDANTSGNFSYTPQQYYDLLYISLGIEISTEIYTLASFPDNPYPHYIKDYSSINYIEVSEDIIIMEESNIQTVTGHHNHIGAYVYVMDNGEIIRDVSSENSFVFSYRVVHVGHHKVDLVVSTSNGSLILATDYYSAKETTEGEEEEDDFAVLGEYKIWLGVGIIVLCLLLPLVISIKSFVDVPIIVYIAMGSIGTGISVSLGLLEMYWLLLLIVALVTGAVISKWG